MTFEFLRRRFRSPRHPVAAYLVRGGVAGIYFLLVGIDPLRWLDTNAGDGIVVGLGLALVVAVGRRSDLSVLATGPAMLAPALYLAIVVSFVEELIFRGAFVLTAAVTPTAAIFATIGSSIAYLVWYAMVWRSRDARSLASSGAGALALAAVTALTRSLWPALIAHAWFILLAGPPVSRPTNASKSDVARPSVGHH